MHCYSLRTLCLRGKIITTEAQRTQGHFDMQAYIDYQAGLLVDLEYSSEEIGMALAGLPVVG